MNPKVTIIIPVYKVEEYVGRCIESVINQTYKNLEIIIIDDGSPDNSGSIADKYMIIDKRILVVHKTNGGLSSARNTGIELSSGEFISFLDGDDWLDLFFVEKLLSFFSNYEVDIVVSEFIKTNEFQKISSIKNNSYTIFSNLEALSNLAHFNNILLTISCSKIYKRALFNGILFPLKKVHEDEFIAHKILNKAQKIIVINQPLYYYFQRPDSITGIGYSYKSEIDRLDAFLDRKQFFTALNMTSNILFTSKTIFFILAKIVGKSKRKYRAVDSLYKNYFSNLKRFFDVNKLPLKFVFQYKLFFYSPFLYYHLYSFLIFSRKIFKFLFKGFCKKIKVIL